MSALLRKIRLTPYLKGHGPRFTLTMYDTGRSDRYGKSVLGYVFVQIGHPETGTGRRRRVLFTGEDFACSPCYAIDSDRAVAALLGFLTLRPGDTDREYFDRYTPEQLEYARTHAETVSAEVSARFGED